MTSAVRVPLPARPCIAPTNSGRRATVQPRPSVRLLARALCVCVGNDAWRLRRTPGLTAAVVTLIALVIGGNTTVFSILHGILTKPAPGVQARGLVTLDLIVNGIRPTVAIAIQTIWTTPRKSITVRPLVVADYERFTLTIPNGSYALRGDLVSTNYFDTLGIRPIAGRAFIGEDDRAQASGLPTVVSERLWQRQFAGAPDVVGQAIALNGHLATIIGVAPPPFAGAVLGESSDIWVPLLPYARVHQTERDVNDRSTLRMWIFGRLTSGNVARSSQGRVRCHLAAPRDCLS